MAITVGGTTITLNSGSILQDPPGTAPSFLCRAWVNFNGTGTPAIRGSGNVSSITDVGTGDYTVNFTTAMTDINFAAVATAESNADADSRFFSVIRHNSRATTSVGVLVVNGNNTRFDSEYVGVAVFR